MSDVAGANFTNGVWDQICDMVWARYSSSSTCIAFVAALLRLLLFAVLFHLLFWWHKTAPGWFITPKGVGLIKGVVLFPKRGGCIPPKGWFCLPKRVVLSPPKMGIKPPGVVLSPIGGWFYAWTT